VTKRQRLRAWMAWRPCGVAERLRGLPALRWVAGLAASGSMPAVATGSICGAAQPGAGQVGVMGKVDSIMVHQEWAALSIVSQLRACKASACSALHGDCHSTGSSTAGGSPGAGAHSELTAQPSRTPVQDLVCTPPGSLAMGGGIYQRRRTIHRPTKASNTNKARL